MVDEAREADEVGEANDLPLWMDCLGQLLWILIGSALACAVAFGWGTGR